VTGTGFGEDVTGLTGLTVVTGVGIWVGRGAGIVVGIIVATEVGCGGMTDLIEMIE
jgi:hypothetical protein